MSLNILICASGELGYTTIRAISSKISIIGILTDISSSKVIDWANDNKVPLFIGNPRKNLFSEKLKSVGVVDILLSINYLFIIEKDLIDLPRIMAINIHGSKLPKYRGRAPHIWAIINGEKSLGITVHQIDEGCDTGDIILQKDIALSNQITGGEVLKKFEAEYPILLMEALSLVKNGSVKLQKQDHSVATVFGKRGPADGEVSWKWESQRALNWIRALTAPYPGAFTFLRGEKIFIWSIEESEIDVNAFEFEQNGKIVKIVDEALFIKIPDKILKITRFTKSGDLEIKVGDIFQGENNL